MRPLLICIFSMESIQTMFIDACIVSISISILFLFLFFSTSCHSTLTYPHIGGLCTRVGCAKHPSVIILKREWIVNPTFCIIRNISKTLRIPHAAATWMPAELQVRVELCPHTHIISKTGAVVGHGWSWANIVS